MAKKEEKPCSTHFHFQVPDFGYPRSVTNSRKVKLVLLQQFYLTHPSVYHLRAPTHFQTWYQMYPFNFPPKSLTENATDLVGPSGNTAKLGRIEWPPSW